MQLIALWENELIGLQEFNITLAHRCIRKHQMDFNIAGEFGFSYLLRG
jgi:hypothetical protein